MEASEAIIVLTLSSHHKGFSSLPWPEQSQRAGGKIESASAPVSARHALGSESQRVARCPHGH